MINKEGQPSGPNPEWELNREQNIATARRIESQLENLQGPNRSVLFGLMIKRAFENSEEYNAIENIEFLKEQGLVDEEGRPVISREAQEMLTNDDIEELTLGQRHNFYHVDNPQRAIGLGVGFCAEAIGPEAYGSNLPIGDMLIGLPENFSFPVYAIEDEGPHFTKYGDLPRGIVGANGSLYEVSNVYCFNLLGQGARIERIYELDIKGLGKDSSVLSEMGLRVTEEHKQLMLKAFEGIDEELKRRNLHVDFIPEEGSRAVPLTTLDDYTKINRALEQIDSGHYKPLY